MMKHIKAYMVTLTLLLIGVGGVIALPASVAMASPKSTVCSALGSSADCSSAPSNGVGLNGTVAAVINILSIVVGITSVIMIIVGGFRFITSGGESGSIASAKNTIMYAVIGLCVVVLAQAIVRFVLNKVT